MGTFISDLTIAYDSAYPIIFNRKKVFEICKPYVKLELKTIIKGTVETLNSLLFVRF